VSRLADAVRAGAVRAGFLAGRLLPLRPRVVLATAHAAQIEGNLRYLHDELARRRPAVRVVVLAHRAAPGRRPRRGAAGPALRAGYHLARERVTVVDDEFFPMSVVRPRPGTTYVQAWHACGAFKKFGDSVLDGSSGADPVRGRSAALHAGYTVCLVSSMAVAPHYAEAFGQPLDRFVAHLGIPRTDLFFDEARAARARAALRRRYRVPEGRRVILYAPTFRGTSASAARDAGHLDVELLHAALGRDHVLLLRLHPLVRDRLAVPGALRGFAIDVSDHPDINELMLVSDVLVTDYSSAVYEFALLGRPILFLAPDVAAYEDERGFYFDFRAEAPGPIVATTAELAALLRAGVFDLDRVEAFRRASFDAADGRASTRVVDRIILPALGGRPLDLDPAGEPPGAVARM
jgi:CDP-glycerol glycerophosphotransferase (TagB/SpsB family)